MILSAMMFALGVMTSGLAWLVLCVLLVRRTRSLTERRLIAALSVTRTEFVAERDELRAKQAVEMYRLEREVSRSLDMATAYRLESDVKEIDLVSARADLVAHDEEIGELRGRFAEAQAANQDLERRIAETATALRSAQHELRMEAMRRGGVEESLEEAGALGQQRRAAIAALERENFELREALGSGAEFGFGPRVGPAGDAIGGSGVRLPRVLQPQSAYSAPSEGGASVVQLPVRQRPAPDEPAEGYAAAFDPSERVAEATRDLLRLAGSVPADEGNGPADAGEPASTSDGDGRALSAASDDRRMPTASLGALLRPAKAAEPVVADLSTHRAAQSGRNGPGPAEDKAASNGKAESRFFRALAEIRALKSSAGPAAE